MSQPENKIEKIENAIDKLQAGEIAVSFDSGGMTFKSMAEIMEFAKLMSVASVTIPPHLRGNPGACLAICIQAVEWKMSPIAVANKSYVVNDRVSYESQLIHAVIEQRAPLIGRLRHKFEGEGANRRCTVWAYVKGEDKPLEFTSSKFSEIMPKNSPLWKTKPDLQLYYNTSRDWARVYFPDVILGVYSSDELGPIIDSREPIGMPRGMSERTPDPEPETSADKFVEATNRLPAKPEDVPPTNGNGNHKPSKSKKSKTPAEESDEAALAEAGVGADGNMFPTTAIEEGQ